MVINKLSTYEQRKKEAKKERIEPRITLRVISRLNPVNQLFFYLLFLLSGVLF